MAVSPLLHAPVPWAIVAFAALGPQGGAPAVAVPIEKRGPALGSKAPELRLQDQGGSEQTLATLSGENGLVLLFVRSADW